ncbi:MAG: class I SAM-dependent methyltransferase [Oscillospiraceae bacterium]|nr:class I SAM-dependent methyltransferase [Oscillospiraceae bacterium]
MRLGERLRMVAELVPPGAAVADIGSDHAYLPAWLAARGRCVKAIASDLREGPLRNAAKTLRETGLEHLVALRLSDGLDGIAPEEADCLIFAGMGGTLIVRLLRRADWIRRPGLSIVAQPMRHDHDLRAYLCANGFHITRELACYEDGRPYIALRAVWDGIDRAYTPGYAFYGELPHCGHPAAREWLLRSLKRMQARAEGLEGAGRGETEARALRLAINDMKGAAGHDDGT